MENKKLFDMVQETVAEVLDVEKEEISEKTRPVVDLDAESLDLLDILFKLSRQTGKKVTMQVIQKDVRGGLTEDEFIDETGYITAAGIEKIKAAIGDENIQAENITSKEVLRLIDIKYIMKIFNETPAGEV
ncbi:acyl carrier protein [Lacrimispora sp.]|uniref:acyl carrier protein n=1 Tax=Lacrimispora sp. TaxID=2719234 RepID=UPI0039946AC4